MVGNDGRVLSACNGCPSIYMPGFVARRTRQVSDFWALWFTVKHAPHNADRLENIR